MRKIDGFSRILEVLILVDFKSFRMSRSEGFEKYLRNLIADAQGWKTRCPER
jgi:hypothetical protein